MNILIAIGLALAPLPVSLEQGVHETKYRNFDFPVIIDADYRKTCACVRLWVSEDRGKSWKQYKEISPEGTRFSFKATRDGHYWFVLQTVSKNGKADPATIEKAVPDQKVYVNQARRPVVRKQIAEWREFLPIQGFEATPRMEAQPNLSQLQRDMKELRETVNQLRKRVADLEKNGSSK